MPWDAKIDRGRQLLSPVGLSTTWQHEPNAQTRTPGPLSFTLPLCFSFKPLGPLRYQFNDVIHHPNFFGCFKTVFQPPHMSTTQSASKTRFEGPAKIPTALLPEPSGTKIPNDAGECAIREVDQTKLSTLAGVQGTHFAGP